MNNSSVTKIAEYEAIQNVGDTKKISIDDEANRAMIRTLCDTLANGRAEISNRIVDLEEAIFLRQLAIIAGVDMFMLSGPGRAKTMLDTCISEQFGMDTFRAQMSKDLSPDYLLGAASVSALLKDQLSRNTTGMLPEADLVTLEEVGNANGPCLDALRMIMSDRVFRNGSDEIHIPLVSLTGISNTWLSGDTIGPVWDRFLIRYELPTPTLAARRAMLETIRTALPPLTRGLINRDEIMYLHGVRDAMALNIPDTVMSTVDAIFSELENKGIVNSFRRYKLCVEKVVPAYALLRGDTSVSSEHLVVLRHCLWDKPSDQRTVSKIVTKIADPMADFVMDRSDELDDIERETGKLSSVSNNSEGTDRLFELYKTIKTSIIPAITTRIGESNGSKEAKDLLARAEAMRNKMATDMLG